MVPGILPATNKNKHYNNYKFLLNDSFVMSSTKHFQRLHDLVSSCSVRYFIVDLTQIVLKDYSVYHILTIE